MGDMRSRPVTEVASLTSDSDMSSIVRTLVFPDAASCLTGKRRDGAMTKGVLSATSTRGGRGGPWRQLRRSVERLRFAVFVDLVFRPSPLLQDKPTSEGRAFPPKRLDRLCGPADNDWMSFVSDRNDTDKREASDEMADQLVVWPREFGDTDIDKSDLKAGRASRL